jgi:flagellar protein FliS
LYDAAITNLVKARESFARGDLRGKRDAVSRSLAIVGELQSALDIKNGGEIAASLDSLYTYVSGRILDFNAQRNIASIDEAHRLMVTLRDGWQQIAAGRPPQASP